MVSVVAPVYGNAATVAELCRRLAAVLPAEHEILLVDDGCPQGSWAAIGAVRGARGIRHEANRGQNAAVLTGLRAARGEEIVVLDADLQDPPEAVPRLLEELRRGEAAVVFGGRRGRYESRARMLGSRLFKRTLRLLSGRRLPADAGLFLAMGPAMRDALTAQDPPHLLAAMARTGLPMHSVPVVRAPSDRSGYSGRARMALAARALAQAARR